MAGFTNEYGATVSSAHDISSMIDHTIAGTPSTYQFPEDRPKYYTQLKLRQYSTPTSQGSIGASLEALRGSLNTLIAGLPSWTPDDIRAGLQAGVKALDDREVWLKGLGAGGGTPAPAPQATQNNIYLPLPVGLTDVHKVHWDEKSIVPWLSSLVGQALAAPVTSVGGLFGLAPNFFQTILFDRPEFKRFELAFKLSPRNFAESVSIRNMLLVLNNAMSPSVESGGLIFGFPNIIDITLKPNNGWLYKFKPAVIETMAINYAGGDGKKAFYHGTENPPESVEITLHVIEIEYWIHGDFKANNT